MGLHDSAESLDDMGAEKIVNQLKELGIRDNKDESSSGSGKGNRKTN